jgi:hypothetical protein
MRIGAIDTIESMCAEEVALRLDDVRRAAAAAVAIEIAERGRQRRDRQTAEGGRRNDPAKRTVALLDHFCESRRDDQVGNVRILGEGGGDLVEELRADDAAGAPDPGDGRHRQAPVKLLDAADRTAKPCA